MKAHIEQRSTPVYLLVRARPDVRLCPAVKESTVDCDAESAKFRESLKGLSSPEVIARLKTSPMPCATSSAPGHFSGRSVHLGALVSALGVDRPVLDRTGLTGTYDCELTWTPPASPDASQPGDAAAAISEGPSVFTALQEQLGLKLERREEPMDVLVIDRIEMPTPN